MGRLEGEVSLITGGASGLGLAIVERFINEGANVCVLDRSAEGCEALRARFGDNVVALPGDVREAADNENLVKSAIDKYGKIDCAIGNAGIWDYNARLVDLSPDELSSTFRELFDVNVLGYMALARAAIKPLTDSQGSIIYTVSNAGFLAAGGGALYTASKHAVVGLVRQLAFEFAPHVRVNGVAPGAISTSLKGPESLGMEDRQFPGERIQETANSYIPIGKMPTPAEYAGAYVFFASREDNVPSTGSVLNHDGGFGIRGLGAVPRGGDDLPDRI